MDNTTPSTPAPATADITPLLTAWLSHQDNRFRGASIAELMASRSELDNARLTLRSSFALAS